MIRRRDTLCLLAALLVLAPPSLVCADSKKDRFVRFLAGCELLRHGNTLEDTARARKYTQLVELTGIDSRSACRIADKYKNRPSDWNEIVQAVRKLLQSIGTTPEKEP
jgi:hypothetical protein